MNKIIKNEMFIKPRNVSIALDLSYNSGIENDLEDKKLVILRLYWIIYLQVYERVYALKQGRKCS